MASRTSSKSRAPSIKSVRRHLPCRGGFRIRVKSGHKVSPGYMARARFVISPTIPRLARPPIFAWTCRMLRSVDVASASISLTMRCCIAGRPRCFPRASAALIPAVTRSLMSDAPLLAAVHSGTLIQPCHNPSLDLQPGRVARGHLRRPLPTGLHDPGNGPTNAGAAPLPPAESQAGGGRK
jgi:hypothetical protein